MDNSCDVFNTRFKKSQALVKKQKDASGGGGNDPNRTVPAWAMRRNKIKLSAAPTKVQLFAGDYDGMPFFEFWATWIRRSGMLKQIFCNCRAEQREAPCLLCYLRHKEQNPNYTPKPRVAINAVELRNFHKIEKVSEKGTTWYAYEKCEGTDPLGRNLCKYCKEEVATIYGKRGYLDLGQGYWNNFMDIVAEIRQVCKTCGGKLYTMKYTCTKCNEVILDLDKTTATTEEREALETQDVKCPSCAHEGAAGKVLACFAHDAETDSFSPGCEKPIPCSPFDVELSLRIQGEGPQSTMVCDNIALLKPTVMTEEIKEKAIPYDFEPFLGGMPVEDQQRALEVTKLPDDFNAPTTKPATVDYT
jgi:hypothetical protein